MGNFKEITDYKDTILTNLIKNERLVQAVGNPIADFLSMPNKSINPQELLYTNIFPYRYLCDPDDKQATFITFYIMGSTAGIITKQNKKFKETLIGFDIYCHSSIVRTNEGCLRYDFIATEIDEMLNSKRLSSSITKAKLLNHTDYSIYEGVWHGAQLKYSVIDRIIDCH